MPNPFASLETVLMRAWMRRGGLAFLLWPLAALFGALTALRRTLYRTGWLPAHRLRVPVIVVGNIFVGGTGKTPFTIWLVQALRAAGFHPGVVSRGYGGKDAAPMLVAADADADPAAVGDEPVLIAQRAACPLAVGRGRVQAAEFLLRQAPDVDVIIADDGLQHYALGRDIEIVLFDARGIGNGWLLPAGPLREPAVRPRDFTIVNGADRAPGVREPLFRMQLHGKFAHRLDDPAQTRALADFAGGAPEAILAAAGIGNPARFFGMLKKAGLCCAEMPLPDHYDYSVNPFAAVTADVILITEKDAVKCARSPALKSDPRLWVVPVEAQLDGMLLDQILEKLRGSSPA